MSTQEVNVQNLIWITTEWGIWMLMMQALEKADEAKNAADKSVEIISTTMTTIDDIFGQIGEYIC